MNDTLAGASPVDQPVRPRRADVVPGVMHCARCKFQLQRVNLYVNVGTVGAGDNDTEPCPNGCGPLWPVTWEQEAREGYKLAEDLFERAKRAEDALRDLVALEDMRLRLRSLHECGHGTDYEHYHKGLPKAWDAARAVLLGPNVGIEPPRSGRLE